jgi:hypothetical protein
MNVSELRPNIGKFGEIKAGEKGYKKTLNGTLADMDTRGTVWFKDNDGYGYAFKATSIDSFVLKEFEPLPDKCNWDGGRTYSKETNKEIDLKK